MKRLIAIALVAVLVFTLGASVVLAAKGDNPANDKSNKLSLYEKDANWDIVWDGALEKMSFNLSDSHLDFVFNGHRLEAKTDYSLIHYPEPQTTWPWGVTVLAQDTSNGGGNIHLAGSADLTISEGIKIWRF